MTDLDRLLAAISRALIAWARKEQTVNISKFIAARFDAEQALKLYEKTPTNLQRRAQTQLLGSLAAFVRDITDETPATPEWVEQDDAAIAHAMETVRRYDASDGVVGIREHHRTLAAFRLLARELVRLVDAGELWELKPLEWGTNGNHYWADSIFGSFDVLLTRSCRWEYHVPKEDSGSPFVRCESLEDGKAKCEAHYRDRLRAAMRPAFGATPPDANENPGSISTPVKPTEAGK
ncbi:MAG: hypothetical protein EKK55_07855 [Rhodocyclaceae bacterium]|nr:MAG: hypothetical protein EKK55_07855 [Rhodocyclaceae bacterium]